MVSSTEQQKNRPFRDVFRLVIIVSIVLERNSGRFTTVDNGSHPELKNMKDILYLSYVNRCKPL